MLLPFLFLFSLAVYGLGILKRAECNTRTNHKNNGTAANTMEDIKSRARRCERTIERMNEGDGRNTIEA
jgi:hypothetical protein